ncbi:hypothetical protein BTVI_97170 [Pitangus sulphuratus]|nr:hypothetical protein BTVI_97170 [Pitangus sulphuratus]
MLYSLLDPKRNWTPIMVLIQMVIVEMETANESTKQMAAIRTLEDRKLKKDKRLKEEKELGDMEDSK